MSTEKNHNGIGTLRESSLHAALKEHLRQPGDQCEANMDGYMIDLIRQDRTLVEIQTGSFSHIRSKLENLLQCHTVQLVYPIPENKWILRRGKDGKQLRRRKSPKHGRWIDVFSELVYITDWIILSKTKRELGRERVVSRISYGHSGPSGVPSPELGAGP